MLGSLTVKPLLIALAITGLLLAGSAAYNVKLLKDIGAVQAECVTAQLETSFERSTATNNAVESALRNQVTELEDQLHEWREVERVADQRHTSGSKALSDFKQQVNEAKKTDPSLNQSADTERLRILETTYRVRTERRREVLVQEDSNKPPTPPLRLLEAQ